MQDSTAGVYISRREMERLKVVDPNHDDLDLKIRAFWFPPYHGAYIVRNGKKYTLVNEEILDSLARYGTGGVLPKKKLHYLPLPVDLRQRRSVA